MTVLHKDHSAPSWPSLPTYNANPQLDRVRWLTLRDRSDGNNETGSSIVACRSGCGTE